MSIAIIVLRNDQAFRAITFAKDPASTAGVHLDDLIGSFVRLAARSSN
jgi:hypothetical protein